jgi:hypothetical protein
VAGTLLHIALAEQALHAAPIDPQTLADINNHIDDFNLGAVLVDLPYYEHLVVSGLRAVAKLDMHYGAWGTLLHLRAPALLAQTLLQHAENPPTLALGLGLLTHLAVDEVFHREIHHRTMTAADGTVSLDTEHKRLEDQMDLHVHYHLLQHSGIGTPYARRKLALNPNSSWVSAAREAILRVHGNAPNEKCLIKWVRALKLFGLVSSTKIAPWVTTLPDDDPELMETSVRLADESVRLASEYIQTGLNYLDGRITTDIFEETIPNRSLLDGGPAEPPRHPHHSPLTASD